MTVDGSVDTTVDEPATGPLATDPVVIGPAVIGPAVGRTGRLRMPPIPAAPRESRILRIAGAVRSPAVVVTLLALCSFAVSLVLQTTLLRDGTGDADEAAYVLQARMLLQGRLTLDASSVEPFFRPWLTGVHDGRVFTKYLPGWPAALALSQALFGTMMVAPAAMAAAWVAGTYRLARELFGEVRTALTAAAGVALSPLVILHTALPLAYAACAATLVFASAELLRGLRTGARSALFLGGAAAGFALLIRPFDAVLVVLPVAVLAVVRARGELRILSRRALWAVLGALPMVAVFLAYCWHVTGSPLRMPLSASDPLDRFGFGSRRILPSESSFMFTRRLALEALGDTLAVAPSWFFGGMGLIVLAAVGLFAPRRRPERIMLLATAGVVLLGYVFWWGSAFAMPGLRNGLGPHYHLAAFTPVVILAADGARWLWSVLARVPTRIARPGLAVAAGVGLVTITLPTLPARIDVQQGVNAGNAFLESMIPDQLDGPAVIVVSPPVPSHYAQIPYHTLRNSPDLDGPVVYAADIGPRTAELPDRIPGRTIYRLRPGEVWDPAVPGSFRGAFVPLRQVIGTRIEIQVTVQPPPPPPPPTTTTTAGGSVLYVRLGDQQRVLRPADGRRHTFVLTTGPATGPDELGTGPANGADGVTLPADLIVGYATGTGPGAAVWEERIPLARRAGGDLSLLAPGLGWRRLPAGPGAAAGPGADQDAWPWISAATRPVLQVDLAPTRP